MAVVVYSSGHVVGAKTASSGGGMSPKKTVRLRNDLVDRFNDEVKTQQQLKVLACDALYYDAENWSLKSLTPESLRANFKIHENDSAKFSGTNFVFEWLAECFPILARKRISQILLQYQNAHDVGLPPELVQLVENYFGGQHVAAATLAIPNAAEIPQLESFSTKEKVVWVFRDMPKVVNQWVIKQQEYARTQESEKLKL